MSYYKMPEKKPIQEIHDMLKDLQREIKSLKIEIIHIKEHIRKENIRQQLRDEKTDEIDKSFEKVNGSWFWG